jgi:O-antigen/teichoic acid export membrane protein
MAYLAVMGIGTVFAVLQIPLFAALLAPAALGYLSVANNIGPYGSIVTLGVLSGLNREIPVALGRGETARVAALVGEVSLFLVAAGGLGLMVYFVVLLRLPIGDADLRLALALGGVLGLTNLFLQLALLRLRGEARPMAFSGAFCCQKTCFILFGAAAALSGGFAPPAIVMIAVNAFLFFYLTSRSLAPAIYRPRPPRELPYLMRIGWPLMAGGLCFNLQVTLDRLFLMQVVPAHTLGVYQFASLPLSLGMVMNGVVGQYVFPRLFHRFGRDGDLGRVLRSCTLLSVAVAAGILLACPIVVWAAGAVIERYFPQYGESVQLIVPFCLGGALVAANFFPVTLEAANRQRTVLLVSAASAVCCAAAYCVLARQGAESLWYAYVSFAGLLVHFVLSCAAAICCLRKRGTVEPAAFSEEPHKEPRDESFGDHTGF